MKSHSFRGYTILLGGIPLKGQFSKDPAINVEWLSDTYELTMGTSGEGTTEDMNDNSATITFRMLSSSDDNAKLQALALADGPSGAGITTCDIVDTKGTTVYHADQGRLSKRPNRAIGTKVDVTEWVYLTDNLTAFQGGN
jgi:hypothetical protein